LERGFVVQEEHSAERPTPNVLTNGSPRISWRYGCRQLIATVLLMATAGLAGCGSGSGETPDSGASSMASYTSVTELSRASDSVVLGTVLDSGVKSLDHGLDPSPTGGASDPALSVRVYRFAVESTLASNSTVPKVLSIVIPDTANGEGISQLNKAQRLVLFLQHYSKTGVRGLVEAWAPISYENGELEVKGSRVVARSTNLRSLDGNEASAAASAELTTNVPVLTETVRRAGVASAAN
jgi:hypothetical protein